MRLITARHANGWQGLRTTDALLRDLSPELRSARSREDIKTGAETFEQRLRATGCYRDVRLSADLIQGRPEVHDITVALDESTFSINTGVSTTTSGTVAASTDFALLNPTGHGEALTLSVGGASPGEVSISDAHGLSGPLFSALGENALGGGGPVDLAQRLPRALSPTISATLRLPTLWGCLTPVTLRARAETERHDVMSGFSNSLREAEVTVADTSGAHSLTYSCALRNVVPRTGTERGAHGFLTGASAAVCADAEASLKSSLIYSYVRDRFSHRGCLPPAGSRAAVTAELAGLLGGDVSFFKTTAQFGFAASAFRFAPDTGFALPLTRRAYLAPSPYEFSDSAARQAAAASLRPHPGPASLGFLGPWLGWPVDAPASAPQTPSQPAPPPGRDLPPQLLPSRTVGSTTEPETTLAPLGGPRRWSIAQQVAGWLAPGATLRVDASLGALLPFGADASRRPTGSRVVDRFFLLGSQVWG